MRRALPLIAVLLAFLGMALTGCAVDTPPWDLVGTVTQKSSCCSKVHVRDATGKTWRIRVTPKRAFDVVEIGWVYSHGSFGPPVESPR